MSKTIKERSSISMLTKGLNSDSLKKYEKTSQFVRSRAVYNILRRTITHLLPRNMKKPKFQLNMGGSSYTNWEEIVVGVPRYFWGMPNELVFSALKALTGHETEHVRSSDQDVFLKFQEKVAEDFTKKVYEAGCSISPYNLDAAGKKLGAHLLNSTEDGRIEKILINRMRGYKKHIQFLNAVIWENQPALGQDPVTEFLYSITSMCVTGLKMKNWERIYGGTKQDKLLNEVRELIIEAINQRTPEDCAEVTFQIYEKIAPYVAEEYVKDLDALEPLMDSPNFVGFGGRNNEDNETPDLTDSSHLVPENGTPQEEQEEGGSESQQDVDSKQQEGKGSHNQKSSQRQNQEQREEGDTTGSGAGENEKGEGKENQTSSSGSENEDMEDGEDSDPQNEQSKDKNGSESGENNNNDAGDDLTSDYEEKRKEEQLVEEFLRQAERTLQSELKSDMEQVKDEEARIKKEEERRKRESGDLSERELKDLILGSKVNGFALYHAEVHETDLPQEIANEGKKLKRKLRQILLDKQGYTRRYQRRGFLDVNSLWRIGTDNYDVFVKKGNPDKSSYVVNILVDNSGSMNDSVTYRRTKFDYAKASCAILEEGLKGIVPFRISFFCTDDWGSDIVHGVISDFGDNDSFNRTWGADIQPMGANADSYSIRVATKELLKRPEDKKILFVLSDGLPVLYDSTEEAIIAVQNAVRDARKAGIIVIAICFGSEAHLQRTRDSYQRMYQHGIVMTSPENVPMMLAKVLASEINR